MTGAEKNFILLQEIAANRRFLLMAYQQNPKLLANAEARIKQLFDDSLAENVEIAKDNGSMERGSKT